MQINEIMLNLLKAGVIKATFTFDDKQQPAIVADQKVVGDRGATLLQHQIAGDTYADACDELIKHAQKAAVAFGIRKLGDERN